MADANGYNYKMTTRFDDGDVVTEYYVTQRGVDMAQNTWRQSEVMELIDAQHDSREAWTIDKFEVEEL